MISLPAASDDAAISGAVLSNREANDNALAGFGRLALADGRTRHFNHTQEDNRSARHSSQAGARTSLLLRARAQM